MTIDQWDALIAPVVQQCDADRTPYTVTVFSREEDRYAGQCSPHMDAGDALCVIGHLIRRFNLSARAIAAMDCDDTPTETDHA